MFSEQCKEPANSGQPTCISTQVAGGGASGHLRKGGYRGNARGHAQSSRYSTVTESPHCDSKRAPLDKRVGGVGGEKGRRAEKGSALPTTAEGTRHVRVDGRRRGALMTQSGASHQPGTRQARRSAGLAGGGAGTVARAGAPARIGTAGGCWRRWAPGAGSKTVGRTRGRRITATQFWVHRKSRDAASGQPFSSGIESSRVGVRVCV
jgi:hypothetical protein